MINEIVEMYVIIDDLLKAISHPEDTRRIMSDAEIITSSLTASLFFVSIKNSLMPNNKKLRSIAVYS